MANKDEEKREWQNVQKTKMYSIPNNKNYCLL